MRALILTTWCLGLACTSPASEPVTTRPIETPAPLSPKPADAPGTASLEQLGPIERSQALKTHRAELDACRTTSASQGKTYKLKLVVDGPKGQVSTATAEDDSPEAACLARAFETKVRFPPSTRSPQEFTLVVSL